MTDLTAPALAQALEELAVGVSHGTRREQPLKLVKGSSDWDWITCPTCRQTIRNTQAVVFAHLDVHALALR